MSRIALLVCMEPNRLESEALILFESFRQFAGEFRDGPLYSYNPRGLGPLSIAAQKDLRRLGVEHSDAVINLSSYPPQSNKVFVAATAEQHRLAEVLVLSDTDAIFLGEPREFALAPDVDIAVSPVWAAGIGAVGTDDPAHKFWEQAYALCGASVPTSTVRTVVTREDVIPYFNSGLVVARTEARVFTRWKEVLETLMACSKVRGMLGEGDSAYGALHFVEQASLAIAIETSGARVRLLSPLYNCPLHYRERIDAPHRLDLDTIVHYHYIDALHREDFWEIFTPPLADTCEQYRWLQKRVPIPPRISTSDTAGFLSTFAATMMAWRRRLVSN